MGMMIFPVHLCRLLIVNDGSRHDFSPCCSFVYPLVADLYSLITHMRFVYYMHCNTGSTVVTTNQCIQALEDFQGVEIAMMFLFVNGDDD